MVFVGHVVALGNGDFGILESLVVEVSLSQNLRAVDHVGVQGHAHGHAELVLHVLALRLFQSDVVDGRYFRSWSKIEVQIHLLADERVDSHRHVGEQSVTPVTLHGISNLAAGNIDLVANGQSGNTCQLIVLIAFNAGNIDTCQSSGDGRAGIRDFRMNDFLLCPQSEQRSVHGQQHHQKAGALPHTGCLTPYYIIMHHFLV